MVYFLCVGFCKIDSKYFGSRNGQVESKYLNMACYSVGSMLVHSVRKQF